jgi:phthalate 4,5-dioxygenase oxygenase subunit
MLTKEENDLLTRVEGDAPMGRLMQSHWIPALLSEEVAEPDGKPMRVRVLGRNLVVFRDSEGRLGALDELCPHRRASLVYGRNEDCGLRCLYHGWKFDVSGNCTDMSSEPPGSALPEKVKQPAYPVHECGGFVWIYIGEGEAPPFERPPFSPDDSTPVSILKIRIPANWAQVMEGQIDSAHSSSLHSSDMVPARVNSAGAEADRWLRPSTDKSPRLFSEITPYGFRYAAVRRPIRNAAKQDYVRITVYVAPFIALIPPNSSYNVSAVIVPEDDHNSLFHFIAWGGNDCPETATWRDFCRAVPGVDLNEDFSSKRHAGNDFGQDRDRMKDGNFTGIPGIPNQDIAMWCSMGSIVDRSGEFLGASDIAIVEFRRLMVDAARAVAEGKPAIGTTGQQIPRTRIASYQGIIDKTVDWRSMGESARGESTPGSG